MITIDNDGNFLFDGKICTDDRIDDIRDFVNSANEAFKIIEEYTESIYANTVPNTTYFIRKFQNILNKVGYCGDRIANCIDNPETTANPDPYSIAFTNYTEGETTKSYWYDSQGNKHPV